MKVSGIFLLLLFLTACGGDGSRKGDRLFKQEKYEEAIAVYEEYLGYNPDHTKSIFNMARSHEELGHQEVALELYQSILEIDPNHVQANVALGLEEYRQERYEKALYFFGNAVSRDDSNSEH